VSVTIKEVARQARVSVGTVSCALSGKQPVAKDTRRRVLLAVEKLGYMPNHIARSLATQRTYTLGVVAYGVGYYGPSQIIAGAEEEAKQQGYFVFLSSLEKDTAAVGEHVRRLQGWQVDGIVVVVLEARNDLTFLDASPSLPIVFTDLKPRPGRICVFVDQVQGAFLATRHLLALGHRRIGTITGPLTYRGSEDRLVGWRRACREAGVEPLDAWVEIGDWSPDSGYRGANALLNRLPDLDALFAQNDEMAFGAIHALSERGLSIPEDVAVVGFDDVPASAHSIPPLTTVHQDVRELGRLAVRTLVAHIEDGDKPPTHLSLVPTLVVRASCGAELSPAEEMPAQDEPAVRCDDRED
jgi:DNA-binding LacI/PurR family transcriptional regulator